MNFKQDNCDIQGCSGKHSARGLCDKHYSRWKRHRNPLVYRPKKISDAERFWSKVKKNDGACWDWIGAFFSGKRRGQFKVDGKTLHAYRFAYELIKGKIPHGLTIDHLCNNPNCVNPDHLEAVTMEENRARVPRKKLCPRGHERVVGTRRCKICSVYFIPSRLPEARKAQYQKMKEIHATPAST